MPNSQVDQTAVSAALDLVLTSSVMTLGTAGEKGPWTAPVYYLYDNQGFYFFSDPQSRHIKAGQNRTCAAAIFRDDPDVRNLRGLQMTGTLSPCPVNLESAGIALAYGKRFKLEVDAGNVLAYFRQAFHAALYLFRPACIYYMDNRSGFGNRTQICL